MIIDNKGRIFGKISVIDLFVVISVLGVITIGVLKFGNTAYTGIRSPEELVQIKFYIGALEDFTANVIEIGDVVSDDANSNFLGNIVDLVIGESVEYDYGVSGITVASPMEGYSSVEITSEVMAQFREGSAIINGNIYSTGSEIIIRAGKAKIQLRISDVIVNPL